MVKHILTYSLIITIVFILVCPCFAADDMQDDSDTFGFAYDNSAVCFFNKNLIGYNISNSNQYVDCSKFYLYVPMSLVPSHLTVYFSFFSHDGMSNITTDSIDYGLYYSNSYHIEGSLQVINRGSVGTVALDNSNAIIRTFKQGINLPDDDLEFNSSRFIRIAYVPYTDNTNNKIRIYTALHHDLALTLAGTVSSDNTHQLYFNGTQNITPGAATYSGSVSASQRTVTINSGSLISQQAYITGGLRSYYDATHYVTSILNSSTTSPNLRLPAIALMANSSNSLGGKIATATDNESGTITLNNMTGTFSGSSFNGSLASSETGTYVQRDYVNSLSVNATRSYDDSELIQHVDDGFAQNHTDLSDFYNRNHNDITNASNRNHTDITNFSNRNHTDLVNIGNNLQKLVDHQEQVNQAGDDIGSTTSSSSISNTSGNLSSGVSGLNSTLSTASDVSSFVSASTPYISFIGAFLPVVLNFGNGVLAWAVVAIIAVTVFLYILKKVSE